MLAGDENTASPLSGSVRRPRSVSYASRPWLLGVTTCVAIRYDLFVAPVFRCALARARRLAHHDAFLLQAYSAVSMMMNGWHVNVCFCVVAVVYVWLLPPTVQQRLCTAPRESSRANAVHKAPEKAQRGGSETDIPPCAYLLQLASNCCS